MHFSLCKCLQDVEGTEKPAAARDGSIRTGHAGPYRKQRSNHLVEELRMPEDFESKLASETFVADQNRLFSVAPAVLGPEKVVDADSDQEKA